METQLLHRGRLIDHIQLVVADIKASRTFYDAVFDVLGVPLGGELGDDFWYDELFVSTKDSEAALVELTGRQHLAFQAAYRAAVDAFYQAGLAAGGRDRQIAVSGESVSVRVDVGGRGMIKKITQL